MWIRAIGRSTQARRELAALASVLFFGCGSGGASDADAGAGGGASLAHLDLGTGRVAFEAAPSGARVTLIQGLQGGYHVWTSFLAYGFSTRVARMDLHTRWENLDGSQLDMSGNVALQAGLDPMGNEVSMSLGWPASIFNPTCVNGQSVLIDVTIVADQGVTASDSRQWIVDVAEEYRSSDCAL